MKKITAEWVAKAEGDHSIVGRELRARKAPSYDGVCFHAQQCVEKLMKAVLILKGVVPPRTHDLIRLHELMRSTITGWDWPLSDLRLLDRAAVQFRYPGDSADKEIADEALAVAGTLREKLSSIIEADV